jgi:hypothetical protein
MSEIVEELDADVLTLTIDRSAARKTRAPVMNGTS